MDEFAAVLWDLDGTLIDSEPLWMAGEHALAESHGATWTQEDGLSLVGNTLIESGRYIKQRIGSDLEPEEIVDYLVDRLATSLAQDIPWRPGAPELVKALDADAVPQALVTMSYAAIARPVVDALTFAAVVTGDQVTHGKPHPEPYLRAAELLGVDAGECLAVEDSVTGATSANAAGCHVLVVPHFVNVPDAPRRAIRASLEDLRPHELRSLF